MSKKVPRIAVPRLVWPGSHAMPTARPLPGPGPLQPKMAKAIQRRRQANVIQCGHDSMLHWEGEADELVDLMETWTPPTPPRPLTDFLKVDAHMPFVSVCGVQPEPFKGLKGMALESSFLPSKGSIVKISFQFGGWNVHIPWPAVWLLRGETHCPAPNRYGFVPSAEFGNPTFMGETSTRTDLGRVAPFTYSTLGAGNYTPEVDFIFGESMSPMKYAQAMKAVKGGMSVATAVSSILGRS